MLHLSQSDDPKLAFLVAISLWNPFAALVNGTPYLPRCTKTVGISPTPRHALLWLSQVVSTTEQRLSQPPGQGDVVRPPFPAPGPAIPNTYILKLKATFRLELLRILSSLWSHISSSALPTGVTESDSSTPHDLGLTKSPGAQKMDDEQLENGIRPYTRAHL